MPVQRIRPSARGTGSGRSLGSSEVQALLLQLVNLRDVLADITDRLCAVEVPANEHSSVRVPLAHPVVSSIPIHVGLRVYGRVLALREARQARHWSQAGLIVRLRTAAAQEGVRLPEPASLKTMLSRWENGRSPVGPMYARLLHRIFDQHPVTPPAGVTV